MTKPLPPEQDTQAARNPAWRIDLDRWEHAEPTECDQLRPHYEGGRQWVCLMCDVKVRVK